MTKLFIVRIFPTLLLILDLFAAAVYAYYGEWGRVVYWVAAALLTASITYWI